MSWETYSVDRNIKVSPSDQAELLCLEAHFHLSYACWAGSGQLGDPHLWTAAMSPGAIRSEQQHTFCLTNRPFELDLFRPNKMYYSGKFTWERKFTQTLMIHRNCCNVWTAHSFKYKWIWFNAEVQLVYKIWYHFQSLCQPASVKLEWASCSIPCREKQAATLLLKPALQTGGGRPESNSDASLHKHTTTTSEGESRQQNRRWKSTNDSEPNEVDHWVPDK